MSIDKLASLRERTTLVKAHNAIEKRGGIDRVLSALLKQTKTGGNALVNAQTSKVQKDLEEKNKLRVKKAAAAFTGRPGQQITAMGTGMAPYQFRAQPQVAATSQEIAGQDLKKAWPGLTPATKSTSPMKRNTGSVMASARRQTGKKARNELVSNTQALLPAPVDNTRTKLSQVDMEKQAWIGGLMRLGKAGWDAAKAWRGAAQTARIARHAQRGGRLLPRGNPTSALTSTRNLPTGNPLRASEFATPVQGAFQRAGSRLFGRGIGSGRNIYEVDNFKFVGRWNPLNLIPGGGRFQAAAYRRQAAKAGLGNVKLVRTGANTGGIVNRAIKGTARGYGLGFGAGYGGSYLVHPHSDDVGAWDKRRFAMGRMGGSYGAAFGGGGVPGLLAGGAYSYADPLNERPRGAEAMAELQQMQGARRGTASKMQAVTGQRNRNQAQRRTNTQQTTDRLTRRAQSAREALGN